MKILDEKVSAINKQIGTINERISELESLILSEKEKFTLSSTIKDISVKFKSQIKAIEQDREAMFNLVKMLIYKVVVYKSKVEIYFIFDKDKPSNTHARQKKNLAEQSNCSLSVCYHLLELTF